MEQKWCGLKPECRLDLSTGMDQRYTGRDTTQSGVSWSSSSCTDTESDPGPKLPSTAAREASSCSGHQAMKMLVKVLRRGWMLNSLCDVLVHSPRPTPSPTLLCLKKYLARGGWRDVSEMSEFSEMLPSRHVKANVVMNSYQLYLPAKHPYKAKPTKLSLRWGRRCLNHSPYWGAISSW